MTPRLLLRAEAKADAQEAFDWYEGRSTGLGFEFLRALRVELASVERAPLQFNIEHADIRRVRLRKFPWSVYYVILPEVVTVIAVLRDGRDERRWQTRR